MSKGGWVFNMRAMSQDSLCQLERDSKTNSSLRSLNGAQSLGLRS